MKRCKICKGLGDVRGDGLCGGCYDARMAEQFGMSYGNYISLYGHNLGRRVETAPEKWWWIPRTSVPPKKSRLPHLRPPALRLPTSRISRFWKTMTPVSHSDENQSRPACKRTCPPPPLQRLYLLLRSLRLLPLLQLPAGNRPPPPLPAWRWLYGQIQAQKTSEQNGRILCMILHF